MLVGSFPDQVDVAIAGAGPAGAAAAIALSRQGYRVLLADAGEGPMPRVGEGLPASTRPLLADLGVLDRVLAAGHRLSSGSHAFWAESTPTEIDTIFGLHGHALQLDRSRFDASLRDAAAQAGAICACKVQLRLQTPADGRHPHRLRLHAPPQASRCLEARWLIDATGRRATLARSFGAKRRLHQHRLAFHQRFSGGAAVDADARTWIEAEADGWWYSVLLPSQQRLIVFVGDPEVAERQCLLAAGGLWNRLSQAPQLKALCRRAGWQPDGATFAADASSAALDEPAGHRWLAVGDAALAFDPLASKGIANALYTGLQAAVTIDAAERGDSGAVSAYSEHLAQIHHVYRQQHQWIHQQVRRWPERPFWQRCQQASLTLGRAA